MRLLGLVGYPLAHSHSPAYFQEIFKKYAIKGWDYMLFPLPEIKDFPALLKLYPLIEGLNVTIPHKQSIIPYCNTLSDAARETQAVNTLRIEQSENGIEIHGHNTDVLGFEHIVSPFMKHGMRALILGAGGSTQAVKYVLNKYQISYSVVSRLKDKGDLTYDELTEGIINSHELIINTTPLGMYPRVFNKPPIPYHYLTRKNICVDIVYNPEITAFLSEARAMGCQIVTGLQMLHHQAFKAWEIFSEGRL